MATVYKPDQNLTFNLPDEGQVFRAVGDNTNSTLYTIKNGQLVSIAQPQYIANTDIAFGGNTYKAGSIVPANPKDGVTFLTPGYTGGAIATKNAGDVYDAQYGGGSYQSLPTYNVADINQAIGLMQQYGQSYGSFTVAPDPSIVGYTNPNPTNPTTGVQGPAPGAGTKTNNYVPPPAVNLEPGMQGDEVKRLQDYLVATGYMTQAEVDTGYGIYGPKTTAAVAALQKQLGVDNSTGVGYWGPRTMTAVTQAATPSATTIGQTSTPAPSQTSITDPLSVPTSGAVPMGDLSLPSASGGITSATYTTSLTTQLETVKQALLTEAEKRAADYQTKISALEQQEKDYQLLQDEGMSDIGDATFREIAEKRAAYDLEKQRFDENYNAAQALVSELDSLLTEGNQVIKQMMETTGLASIMQPRISKTMTDIQARAGVIEAVLAARNGQMANAQNQLVTSLNAISSIYNDEINYYKTVVNYYGSLKGETADKIANLSKDQKDYLDVKLNTLATELAQIQNTANMIQKAMLDPDTAQAYGAAGVTLKDSVETINRKLATYAYSQEIVSTYNTMTTNGYTTSPIPGVQPVPIADSQGKVKYWYKAPDPSEGFTLGTNQVRFDANGNVLAQGPQSADAGSGGTSNPSKLTSSDRQVLLGANFTNGDIASIENDVASHGLDAVLNNLTDEQQKSALRKVYGASTKVTMDQVATQVTQKTAQDGLQDLFTDEELQKMADEAGYRHWWSSWASEKEAYLNSPEAKQAYVEILYKQYQSAGLAQ